MDTVWRRPGGPLQQLLAGPAKHIRWKIILPYAVLVAVLAGVQTYVATSLVHDSLDERFENQLLEASRSASDSVVRQEQAHLEVARSVAFTQGLAQAIESGDEARVTSLIHSIAANSRTERIEVLDDSGARVSGVQLTDEATLVYGSTIGTDNPALWPLVTVVLNDDTGRKAAQVIETSTGTMLMTASPAFDGNRRVGMVVVGTSMATIAAEMKADALADVTFYDFGGAPLASTFVLDSQQADLSASAAALAPAPNGSQVARESRVIWGRHYDLLFGNLVVEGQSVGYYSAALPSDFIFDAATDTRWQITLIFGAGMAMVLGIGILVARSLTQRIQQLVTSAERVTQGDLTARTDVDSEDELGRLAVCMNRMTARLEGQYMATMRALASAVAGENPYTVRHSRRVGELAMLLGRKMGVDELTLAQLEIGGYLHDIGKIGVRDSGLLDAEELPADQVAFIDSHPHIGLEAPQSNNVSDPLMTFIRGEQSHSHRGGASKLDEFGFVGRIVAVADLYDALTADRPAGEPMEMNEALAVMRAAAAAQLLHFGTVEALSKLVPEWERSQGRGSDYRELVEQGS
ncbi:MAG: HD domain-containing phosphohydrolase [Dehalococcoidia bacterium]